MRTLIIALLVSTGALANDYTPDQRTGPSCMGITASIATASTTARLHTRENRIAQEWIRLNG
jgi:hypothetical protein